MKIKVNFDGNSLKKTDNIIIDASNDKISNDNNININHDNISSNKSLKKTKFLLKSYTHCINKNSNNGIFSLVKNPFFRNNVPAPNYMGHIPLIDIEFYGHSQYERSKKIYNNELVSNKDDEIENELYSYEELKKNFNEIRMKNTRSKDIYDLFDPTRYNKRNIEDVKNTFTRENIPSSNNLGHIPFEKIAFHKGINRYEFSKKIFSDKFLSTDIYNPENFIPYPEKKDKFPNVFNLLFSIKSITNNTIEIEQNDITNILEPFLEKEKFVELVSYKFHQKTEYPKCWSKILSKELIKK